MAVSKKAITANPIKNGAVVCLTVSQVPQEVRPGDTLPDSTLTDLDTKLYGVGRNRLYYTTGEPDPADPS